MIKKDLFDELREAKLFAILADEVTSNNTEHLALCVRFVDKEYSIREEFLTFIPLQRITGEQIAETILNFLGENNIDAENIRGQGYDGASNMSSDRLGVQARIRKIAPLAIYVHCSGHYLNLVIRKSCSLPSFRSF